MRFDLIQLTHYIKYSTILNPTNFFEIGSRDGHDTKTISDFYKLPSKSCFIFEAHPDCYKQISYTYDFNVFHLAVTNENKYLTFNAAPLDSDNIGASSLTFRDNFKTNSVEVQGYRLDTILESIPDNQEIDLMKLDVEGHTYEVLEGAGDRLKSIKAIQLELEHVEIWPKQKLYDDVKTYLYNNGFIMVNHVRLCNSQSDSLFIQPQYLKPE